MQSDLVWRRNLSQQKKIFFITAGRDLVTLLSSPFVPASSSPSLWGQLIKLEFLGAVSRPEIADIEQMKKIVPLITCEIPFSQNVCELMFGVNVTDLNFGIQISPVKQPIQSNSVGSWHMSHCGTSTFDNHLVYCLHSTRTRMPCIWWKVINVCWNDDWDGVMQVWFNNCRRVSPWLSLGSICSVRYGMKYFNHQIPESESGNTVHA